MSAAEQQQEPQHSSNTHFVFENKVFKVEGCFFSVAETGREVIFNIPMGEMVASIKLKSLVSEFGIDTSSPDYQLLDLVQKGIPYVRQIRPNDIIPSEVLDGSASWQIDPDHAAMAINKLSLRLVNWLTGEDVETMDQTAMLQIDDNEELQASVNQGLEKAAKTIKRKKEEVISRFEDIAKELAYIEALRDYYTDVYRLYSYFKVYQNIYSDDSNFKQEIERMRQLMKPPVENIKKTFDRIDYETLEVLPLLKSYTQKVEMIRNTRDELHLETRIWQDLQNIWIGVPQERCEEAKLALQSTYKFLAKNFTVSYSW
jgi:hypothetical protein